MEFLRRNHLILSALFLVVFSAQLMSLSVGNPRIARFGTTLVTTVISPALKLQHEASESVKYLWTRYLWLLNVEEEKNNLEKRVTELETMNSRLLEYQNENVRLRNILHFAEDFSFHGVVANVIGSDPSNWFKTLVLDKGRVDGIAEGYAVISGNAVVGQVVAVTQESSKILLITDVSSAIDAIIQGNRMWGVAEGVGPDDLLRLRYVEKRAELDVAVGDRVITSGLDGIYPKGLLIGVIHSVNAPDSSLFYSIKLRPALSVKRLENVFIVVPNAGLSEVPTGSVYNPDGNSEDNTGSEK